METDLDENFCYGTYFPNLTHQKVAMLPDLLDAYGHVSIDSFASLYRFDYQFVKYYEKIANVELSR